MRSVRPILLGVLLNNTILTHLMHDYALQETEWSDKVSSILERLHMCSLAGASQGGG